MTNPTSNFGWQMPTSTDLVTDLPADFETFGQAVDTSLADLKGGTTGQVLSKASNTDMDFTWVAQDDSNAIQNAIVDAKGDLIAASAADTPARLAVGTNGQVLTADSTAATGLAWATPSTTGGQYAAGKNKFINGDMSIAQRGAAAVTVSAGARFFSIDRTFGQLNGAGAFTVEQVVDAPAAANASQYSLKAVVTTADTSIAANDQYWLGQIIEAQNFASFQFGTASAQTVTISFWVKSSITGTFGIDIRNSAADRSYVSTYTISAANTWEYKTVTIAGDTSGTWLKDTGVGARIEWVLSAGTDFQTGSANSWTASNDMTTSAQTNFMGTLSNSFQITAIQIEQGSTATAFQTATGNLASELSACQRYYYRVTATQAYSDFANGYNPSSSEGAYVVPFPVQMRTTPTALEQTGTASNYNILHSSGGGAARSVCSSVPSYQVASQMAGRVYFIVSGGSLTAGQGSVAGSSNNTTAYLGWSAEL